GRKGQTIELRVIDSGGHLQVGLHLLEQPLLRSVSRVEGSDAVAGGEEARDPGGPDDSSADDGDCKSFTRIIERTRVLPSAHADSLSLRASAKATYSSSESGSCRAPGLATSSSAAPW